MENPGLQNSGDVPFPWAHEPTKSISLRERCWLKRSEWLAFSHTASHIWLLALSYLERHMGRGSQDAHSLRWLGSDVSKMPWGHSSGKIPHLHSPFHSFPSLIYDYRSPQRKESSFSPIQKISSNILCNTSNAQLQSTLFIQVCVCV